MTTLLTRLLRMIEWDDIDECWLWTGYINSQNGYGQISVGKADCERLALARTATAPKAMCALVYGPAPPGYAVRHSCDVRACCAPHHLSWGTPAQNNHDAWTRGGQKRGEQHHRAKYADAEIAELRRRVDGGETAYGVAQEMGIDISYAYQLAKGMHR